jgi:very-short-patch-repair endonuclease
MRRVGKKIDYSGVLALQFKAFNHPEPAREFRFYNERRWRFDLAWPELKLAAEIEGGIYTGGRHTSIKGFTNDCDKYNTAQLLGWRVFRFPTAQVINGKAYNVLRGALHVFNPERAKG